MHIFSQYSVWALWSPILAAVLVLTAVLYLKKEGTSARRKTFFLSALALIYLAAGSPFSLFARDDLFTAFMVQQSILYLVVPPFLIIGTPLSWLRPLLWQASLKKVFRVLTYPWLTAILFNPGFSVFLLPSVFRPIHASPVALGAVEIFFFAAAVFMWWSILSPLPELNPLSELQRIFYLFLTALMLTPIAMLMLFSHHNLYPAFANSPYLSAIYDQQIGGGVLKGFQLTAYGIELAYLISGWFRSEREKEQEEQRGRKVVPIKKVR
ncbi:MAG TPA: cytochrome c oxidase assembly protein [Bacillales bacterium]|nr:cytochrome c oxidase assembly protein [Bacillales bacterium]